MSDLNMTIITTCEIQQTNKLKQLLPGTFSQFTTVLLYLQVCIPAVSTSQVALV